MIENQDQGKHYIYRHIRLDKKEPFYIGVGTKSTKDMKYSNHSRAKSRNRRGIIWVKITRKTDWYYEILLESNSYDFILQKEKEFIKLYGRKDKKTGILVNMTDGGEGSTGVITSRETRELKRKNGLGRIITEEAKIKAKITIAERKALGVKYNLGVKGTNGKRIFKIDEKGNLKNIYESALEAAGKEGLRISAIQGAASDNSTYNMFYKDFYWIYEEDIINHKIEKISYYVKKKLTENGMKKSKYGIGQKINIIKKFEEINRQFSSIRQSSIFLSIKLNIPPDVLIYIWKDKNSVEKRYKKFKEDFESIINSIMSLNGDLEYFEEAKKKRAYIIEHWDELVKESKEFEEMFEKLKNNV